VSTTERVLGGLVRRNNAGVRRRGPLAANPLPTADLPWVAHLVSAHGDIRGEWERFVGVGGRLPLIDEVLGEPQGSDGSWRAGLLVSRGRPCGPVASSFPLTTAVLSRVPGLRSALWSVLDPGAELAAHEGPNAGVLRFHLGVDCGESSALLVDGLEVPYRDGVAVLFDDTVRHSAWNHGDRPRVTLFCEVLRPLPRPWCWTNRAVQSVLGMDPRYRRAPARAADWHLALNVGQRT
jgi:hypothetical protein